MRIIVALGAIAFGASAWRNVPPIAHPYAPAAAVTGFALCAVAYWCGYRDRRTKAVATAVANAEARAAALSQSSSTSSAAANVFVVNGAPSMAAQAEAALGLGRAPWMVDAHRQVELGDSVQDYDSMLDEIAEGRHAEG